MATFKHIERKTILKCDFISDRMVDSSTSKEIEIKVPPSSTVEDFCTLYEQGENIKTENTENIGENLI